MSLGVLVVPVEEARWLDLKIAILSWCDLIF